MPSQVVIKTSNRDAFFVTETLREDGKHVRVQPYMSGYCLLEVSDTKLLTIPKPGWLRKALGKIFNN
jgi:hypothetical protein